MRPGFQWKVLPRRRGLALAAGLGCLLVAGCVQRPPAPVSTGPAAADLGESPQGAPPGPPGADATVTRIFMEQCAQCHSIGKVGTNRVPLDHEGKLRTKEWIRIQIRRPDRHNPHTEMPLFPGDRMNDRELDDLAGYLASLK